MLYQTEIGQASPDDVARTHPSIGADDVQSLEAADREYAESLARGAWEGRGEADTYIGEAARNWRLDRMAVVDRLVLRLAFHELVAYPATPPRVVIDEAIELARAYSGDEAARFVNGVLDGMYKRLRDEGKTGAAL